MSTHNIICADVLEWAKEYEGEPFHALLADCPWHLKGGFMNRYWDQDGPDAISFQSETWAVLAEHLHPGAFLFVFAGSRGWHRLACALEDAGLIIQPSIFVWGLGVVEVPPMLLHLQAQAFPKATRIDAQIEKRRNDDLRPVCRFLRMKMDEKGLTSRDIAPRFGFHSRMVDHWAARDADSQPTMPTWEQWLELKEILGFGDELDAEVKKLNERKGQFGELWHQREVIGEYEGDAGGFGNERMEGRDNLVRAPATDLARAWEGHRYGGQILKDAATPIIVAQKPWTNPRLDCIVETGAGSLWVDGGRIGTHEDLGRPVGLSAYQRSCGDSAITHGQQGNHPLHAENTRGNPQGRWPANFALCHVPPHLCPDCSGDGCEACDGRGVVGGCRRVMVEETCPVCDGSGFVAAEPITETWEEWYEKTKDYGGTREEYDRLTSPGGSSFCRECGGKGAVKRVGVRRVRPGPGAGSGKVGDTTNSPQTRGIYGSYGEIQQKGFTYADPDGLETVDAWECAEGCVCAKLGEMSGESGPSRGMKPSWSLGTGKGTTHDGWRRPVHDTYVETLKGYADKGTAARFYHQAGWEYECIESCPVHRLDEQAGERITHATGKQPIMGSIGYGSDKGKIPFEGYEGSSGGASRFYAQAGWSHEIAERLATGDPVRYVPKAAKRERNQNLDDFYWRKDKQSPIGFTRITKDEWEALGEEEQRIKAKTGKRVSLRAQGNIHPTIKSISLCKWIATLALPPKEYAPRRIWIPFCGTFSEGIGAILAGWEEVVGVELYRDHCDIAEARAAFWARQPRQLEL